MRIESMISVARTTTGRVKHWRDRTMKKRWIAAGRPEAKIPSGASKAAPECPILLAAIKAATSPTVTPTVCAQSA
jgi:hypothetical protein